jgi:hypothetical protein
MKFIVSRTSVADCDRPCPEAQRELLPAVEQHYPAYLPLDPYGTWFTEGRNHRIQGGIPTRDVLKPRWTIDIDSLDTLIQFVKEHGDVVVHNDDNNQYPELEIYDDYRE